MTPAAVVILLALSSAFQFTYGMHEEVCKTDMLKRIFTALCNPPESTLVPNESANHQSDDLLSGLGFDLPTLQTMAGYLQDNACKLACSDQSPLKSILASVFDM